MGEEEKWQKKGEEEKQQKKGEEEKWQKEAEEENQQKELEILFKRYDQMFGNCSESNENVEGCCCKL